MRNCCCHFLAIFACVSSAINGGRFVAPLHDQSEVENYAMDEARGTGKNPDYSTRWVFFTPQDSGGILLEATQVFAITDVAYLDVTVAGSELGRIEIGLFGEITPKTVANFIAILTEGIDGRTYAGTKFHRVLNRFIIQGGDIVNNDGSGSVSIYGDTFPDEYLKVNGTKPGFVGMANSGPDTNGCQFFITTRPTPSLNGEHVLFGIVLNGQKVMHMIGQQLTDHLGRPAREIRITKCGLLDRQPPFEITDDPRNLNIWRWITASALPLSMSAAILLLFHWMISQINKVID